MQQAIAFILGIVLHLTATCQPNILLVIADDLGLDPTPNYLPGPQKAAMPNLEALMGSGLTFDNVWANPLCSPTRATILTGRYGARTGVLDPNELSLIPSDEITLHRYLNDIGSGYATSLIGKWHLGGTVPDPAYPNTMGIPYYAGLLRGGVQSYTNWQLTTNGTSVLSTDYITTALTDLAINWVGQQTEPWFCWLAYNAPHTPYHLPPQELHSQGALSEDPVDIEAAPLPYYLAMCESVDHEMQRVLDSLDPEARANTVVIFIGDNGTQREVVQSPYPMSHGKGTLYEGGVRVPLVISGPGIARAGERETALVNTSDLFATIVELTGAVLPEYEDSRSLAPLFTQAGGALRACAYAEVNDLTVGTARRNERYKRIELENGEEQFYDLLVDPFELNDLLPGPLTSEELEAFKLLASTCESSVGIEERQVARAAVHPVPAGDWLTVTGNQRPATYSVYTSDGRRVMQGTIGGNAVLDVGALPAGVYILQWNGQRIPFVKE